MLQTDVEQGQLKKQVLQMFIFLIEEETGSRDNSTLYLEFDPISKSNVFSKPENETMSRIFFREPDELMLDNVCFVIWCGSIHVQQQHICGMGK